jgi:hypothetical protein
VVDADRRILDFRVVQRGPAAVELALDEGLAGEAAEAARAGLAAALARAGVGEVGIVSRRGLSVPTDRKLRRVERAWREG